MAGEKLYLAYMTVADSYNKHEKFLFRTTLEEAEFECEAHLAEFKEINTLVAEASVFEATLIKNI